MTKQDYMAKLQEKLERFGRELQEEILEDYRQHFAEGANEGKSEEEIIEELGNIEEMIRELAEEDLPGEFAQRAMESGAVAERDVEEPVQQKSEEDKNARDTGAEGNFNYSGNYKSVVLDGKVANIHVERSEDDRIHVNYEAKGLSSQLNYEFYQYEDDGIFYAGVKRRKNLREEDDGEEKMVKVTLFGHTIISYGTVGSFGGGQYITLTVKIPREIPKVTAKTNSGNVEISGLELEFLEGYSGSGNVEIRELVADRVKGHTGSGNLAAEHVEFISAGMEAGSGNIKLERIKGKELRCNAGSGNIKADAAVADYHLNTGSGNIKLKAVGTAETVNLSAGSGSVKLELEGIEGMEATVRTGSGSAHIAWGQEEAVKVKNGTYSYGNGACKVKANTGSGSIRISG